MITLALLSCTGLTLILLYGKPTAFLRETFLKDLLKCSLCTGFWVGIIHLLFLFPILGFQSLLLPCASAAVSWLLDSLILLLQICEIKVKGDVERDS